MIDNTVSNFITRISSITRVFFGVTNHAVFVDDGHFDNYNHIVAVKYIDKNNNETWLPIINENGQPESYIYGCNWVNWTFRVNYRNVDMNNLERGIKRYTAFWAGKNGVNLTDQKFKIVVKKIEVTKKWEKDFLSKQIAKPWIDGGYILWENNEFKPNIKHIESL